MSDKEQQDSDSDSVPELVDADVHPLPPKVVASGECRPSLQHAESHLFASVLAMQMGKCQLVIYQRRANVTADPGSISTK